MTTEYRYEEDPGQAAIQPDGSSVIPTVRRAGAFGNSPEWAAWFLVVGSVVVIAGMRKSFRGLIPGTS
jgi:hypothetical protein